MFYETHQLHVRHLAYTALKYDHTLHLNMICMVLYAAYQDG